MLINFRFKSPKSIICPADTYQNAIVGIPTFMSRINIHTLYYLEPSPGFKVTNIELLTEMAEMAY